MKGLLLLIKTGILTILAEISMFGQNFRRVLKLKGRQGKHWVELGPFNVKGLMRVRSFGGAEGCGVLRYHT